MRRKDHTHTYIHTCCGNLNEHFIMSRFLELQLFDLKVLVWLHSDTCLYGHLRRTRCCRCEIGETTSSTIASESLGTNNTPNNSTMHFCERRIFNSVLYGRLNPILWCRILRIQSVILATRITLAYDSWMNGDGWDQVETGKHVMLLPPGSRQDSREAVGLWDLDIQDFAILEHFGAFQISESRNSKGSLFNPNPVSQSSRTEQNRTQSFGQSSRQIRPWLSCSSTSGKLGDVDGEGDGDGDEEKATQRRMIWTKPKRIDFYRRLWPRAHDLDTNIRVVRWST